MVLLQHHLTLDHVASDLMMQELAWIQAGRNAELPAPVPFRNFVAQARRGVSVQEHEAYFRKQLGDVQEPTTPFGLQDVQRDGQGIQEAQLRLDPTLSARVRHQAKALGVSAASLFHWAWALVLAKTTDRDDVVFGTVLFGRMQGGEQAHRALGLFINTLPLRLRLGDEGVQEGIRHTHQALAHLMWHEHAPLALAQRCSGLPAGAPLFSALLNYHYSASASGQAVTGWGEGVQMLAFKERTNYPFTLSVGDHGQDFLLEAQVAEAVGATRVCGFMQRAIEAAVQALEQAPQTPSWRIDILSATERQQALVVWNQRSYPLHVCIQRRFEQQVEFTPTAVALVQGEQSWSYERLNRQANRLAHHLGTLGVGPEVRVALCLPRGADLLVAMLAVLKAGGAYVPLDPTSPPERQRSPGRVDPAKLARESGGRHGVDAGVSGLAAPARHQPSAPRTDPAAPGLCGVHLRLYRPAQGRDGGASQPGQLGGLALREFPAGGG
jgi:non-ribosomal peptide synthetase component F